MKITVAIPCYNLEDKISTCLESVLLQDYCDIEILVIDDHSTDNSVAVIRHIIEKYPERNFRFIVNDINLGLNAVRNQLIREAHGDYLYFLDGDDTIEPGSLFLFSHKLEETHSEVICGSFRTIDSDGSTILVEKHFVNDDIKGDFAYASYIEKYIKGYFHVAVWNNLYSLDFLKSHNIVCATHYKNYEDILFTFKVVLNAHSVSFISDITYNYCRRLTSISYEEITPEWFMNIRTVIGSVIDAYNVFKFNQKGKAIPAGIRFLVNNTCLTNGLLKKGLESEVDKQEKLLFISWLKNLYRINGMNWGNIVGTYNKISYLILFSTFAYPLFRFYFKNIKTISMSLNLILKVICFGMILNNE